MIRIHAVPKGDVPFWELVRYALNTAGATDRSTLVADDEAMLQRALAVIRRECPDATVRRQDPLAASGHQDETWYVFRDTETVLA